MRRISLDPDTIAVLEEHRGRALQPAELLDVASIDEWYLFSSDPAHGRPLNPDWVSTGYAFVQNLRRGHYELGLDIDRQHRLPAAFTEFARAILRVIESINDTFKGQLSLEQHGGHTPAGVWVRAA